MVGRLRQGNGESQGERETSNICSELAEIEKGKNENPPMITDGIQVCDDGGYEARKANASLFRTSYKEAYGG